MPGSDLSAMTATGENDKTTADFNVRATIDEKRPGHSELVFRKYGDTEFLSKAFEAGSKTSVCAPSRVGTVLRTDLNGLGEKAPHL
jgi:hypothetical protein